MWLFVFELQPQNKSILRDILPFSIICKKVFFISKTPNHHKSRPVGSICYLPETHSKLTTIEEFLYLTASREVWSKITHIHLHHCRSNTAPNPSAQNLKHNIIKHDANTRWIMNCFHRKIIKNIAHFLSLTDATI